MSAGRRGAGEYVSLGKNLKARGEVENWLSAVEKAMVAQVKARTS